MLKLGALRLIFKRASLLQVRNWFAVIFLHIFSPDYDRGCASRLVYTHHRGARVAFHRRLDVFGADLGLNCGLQTVHRRKLAFVAPGASGEYLNSSAGTEVTVRHHVDTFRNQVLALSLMVVGISLIVNERYVTGRDHMDMSSTRYGIHSILGIESLVLVLLGVRRPLKRACKYPLFSR